MSKSPARRGETLPDDYPELLADIKARVDNARTQAVLAVNAKLVQLYWEIGREILKREDQEGWGARVIDRLAADLRREYPDATGFSRSNLKYMRAFAAAWPAENGEIGQQPVGQMGWGHNITLLTKLDDADARAWYAAQAVAHGWSRAVLTAQIDSDLRGRTGGALSSFDRALPSPDSELVSDMVKDPYNFDFLNLSAEAKERDLELALLNDVQKFLMEMGHGFALVGRQYPLRVLDEETGEEAEFFLDLLFYNFVLRRFVVIDLKIEPFKPEFAGKMNFHLNAVDELLRQEGDSASIGLVLCPDRHKTVTQWALRGVETPVAVARYTTGDVTLTDETPSALRPALPELPELASELTDITEAADMLYDADYPLEE